MTVLLDRDRFSIKPQPVNKMAQERAEEIRSAAYFWGGQAADGMGSLDWEARFEVFNTAIDSAVVSLPDDLSDVELDLVEQLVARTAIEELGDSAAVVHPLHAAILGMSSCPVHRLVAAVWSATHRRLSANLPTLMRPNVVSMDFAADRRSAQ